MSHNQSGFYTSHRSPLGRNGASYESLLEGIVEGWKTVHPVTQDDVGVNSQQFYLRLKGNVDLYQGMLTQEDCNPEIIESIEGALDQTFARILNLVGDKFCHSSFGSLHLGYNELKGGRGVVIDSNDGIIIRINKMLDGYERFLGGGQKEPVPLSEGALVILGNYVMKYAPNQMTRYEQILDGLEKKTKVDVGWVRDVVGMEGYRGVGIGAMVTAPSQLQRQP